MGFGVLITLTLLLPSLLQSAAGAMPVAVGDSFNNPTAINRQAQSLELFPAGWVTRRFLFVSLLPSFPRVVVVRAQTETHR